MNEQSNGPAQSDSRTTGSLEDASSPVPASSRVYSQGPSRDSMVRAVEQVEFLAAVIGAIALGLGITGYFGEHRYISAYLLAYVGFRVADLAIGHEPHRPYDLWARTIGELPVLIVFAAAPFERTYLWGGEPAAWPGAFGLLLELTGLWLALGSRVQLHFFSSDYSGRERMVLVKTGFFKYIRHPVYAGVLLVTIAWPIAFGAGITTVLTILLGLFIANRQISADEQVLSARFGEEFDEYRRTSAALIPNVW